MRRRPIFFCLAQERGEFVLKRTNWREQISAYMFLAPALVVFAVFAWWPMINSLLLSFQRVCLTERCPQGDTAWVALDNFQRMLADRRLFEAAWRNSFEFAILSVIMGFFVPVVVAILVNEMRHAKGFFRVVYFLPSVIPPLVSILVWQLIYKYNGLLNLFLDTFGIEKQRWLSDPALVKPSMLIVMTWAAFGSTMLIYLAALQDLPVELYEAAEIDGASPWQRLRSITIPHLRSTMLTLLIIQVIGIVQIFLEPFLLTKGGPGNATTTPVLVIYNKGFLNFDFGLASAWSVVLIIVLAIFSVIYLRVTRAFD